MDLLEKIVAQRNLLQFKGKEDTEKIKDERVNSNEKRKRKRKRVPPFRTEHETSLRIPVMNSFGIQE